MLGNLDNRIILKLVFKSTKPFVISPIRGGIYSENVCVVRLYTDRNGNKVTLIPSSTLKGVFRRISEYVSNSIDFKDKIINHMVCNHREEIGRGIIHGEFDPEILDEIFDKYNFVRLQIERDGLERDEEKWNEACALICPICTLYGSNFSRSKLWFYDSLVYCDERFLSMYHRVGIDRKKGIQREKSLYAIQALPPGIEFKLIIVGNNLNKFEKIVLKKTIKYISVIGLQLGAERSRGFGLFELDKEKSAIYMLDFRKIPDLEKKIRMFTAYFYGDREFKRRIEDFITSEDP